MWIALEDADVENSCLWFAPGTHKSEWEACSKCFEFAVCLSMFVYKTNDTISLPLSPPPPVFDFLCLFVTSWFCSDELSYRMIRNPDGSDPPTTHIGTCHAREVKDDAFVPVPVKKGNSYEQSSRHHFFGNIL